MPDVTPHLSKQHPVPQHISSFEFKLIGDLTLRQFLFAGTGVAIAYAAYVSGLNIAVKWTIIFISAGLGLGTAFFPIQERTLDRWVLNFIAAFFSPTQRVWRKTPYLPEFLREDYGQFLARQVLAMTPVESRKKLVAYLAVEEGKRSRLDTSEAEFMRRLNFDIPLPAGVLVEERPEIIPPPPPPHPIPQAPPPSSVRPSQLVGERQIPLIRNVRPGRPMGYPVIEGTILFPIAYRQREPSKVIAPVPTPAPPRPSAPPPSIIAELKKEKKASEENQELMERLKVAESQLKPYEAAVEIVREEKRAKPPPPPPISQKKIPNLVSGVVKDAAGKFLENTVIIIKDQNGDPVRALKTNRLGQFAISTPLENDNYTVEVAGVGRHFDIMKVVADGRILPPLEFKERYAGS